MVASTQGTNAPRIGDRMDLAEYAVTRWWTGGERYDLKVHEIFPAPDGTLLPARDPATSLWQIGLEWENPRHVRQVVIRYADTVPPDVQVQYWRKNWPTIAPERLAGARRGWIGCDDPWHGQWVTARGEKIVAGDTCTITFDPIDLRELGGRHAVEELNFAEHYRAAFRRTLKIRVVSAGETQPKVKELHAYSSSTWQEVTVDLWLGVDAAAPMDWSGHAEAFNGRVLAVEPLVLGADETVSAEGMWRCCADGAAKGLRLWLLCAHTGASNANGAVAGDVNANDRTIITVHTAAHTFSFLVDDLAQGPIYIPDYHVFITRADAPISYEAFKAQRASAPRLLYDRVLDEPEQSLGRALAEIPRLDETITEPFGRYLPLAAEAGRQEWAIRYNGELFGDKVLLKLWGRDAARLTWPGHQLRFRFGTGDPIDFRERRGATQQSLQEGWLPVVTSVWLDREIEYTQTTFAALIDGPMTGQEARRGDEDIAAMMRFTIRNTTPGRKWARLWIVIAPQEKVELRENLVVARGRVVPAEPVARQWKVAPYDAPVLRCAVDTRGRGALGAVAAAVPYPEPAASSQAIPTAIAYDIDLEGGESHTIVLAFPFVSFVDAADWRKVAALDFETKLAEVVAFWKSYVLAGGQLDLPEPLLNDFHRAARAHVAISVDKDPTSGLYVVPAATWAYGACGNEACWQITMLDQAGHHERARAYLETFLATQGALKPDGKFVSAEGALQGLDLDAGTPVRSGFGYNLDHGYIMECLVHHYRITGDRAWLERVAPNLVSACEFIIRERHGTKVYSRAGQPVIEWGLLPAGHLEDNPEWRHWFAVNAHAYAGLKGVAEVLATIDHPESSRLDKEAAAYREDIRRAALRSMEAMPVVRLRDGSYVPHIPTRTGLRGREWGWFREAAYGALHLMECGVFEPNEPAMTWLLKDLEDNLFVSREWGRPVDIAKYWFSHGGVTIQANLMDLAIDYLRRGQIEHGLRSLFNNFGASIYPDVRAFTEHPVVELGHGIGPFYKTPDESKSLVWLRAFLVREEGQALHVAPGAPRAWFAAGQAFGLRKMATFFGPLTYRIEAAGSRVTARIELTDDRPPEELIIHLRRPDKQPLRSVTVNGQAHSDYDVAGEWVRVQSPKGTIVVEAQY